MRYAVDILLLCRLRSINLWLRYMRLYDYSQIALVTMHTGGGFSTSVLFITTGVYSSAEIQLTVLGPHSDESTITLCPDQNYTIAFECVVVDSISLLWGLEPLLRSPEPFLYEDELGEVNLSPITLILTDKMTTSDDRFDYKSQLLVSTERIISAIVGGRNSLNVTCTASDNVFKSISIQISGMYVHTRSIHKECFIILCMHTVTGEYVTFELFYITSQIHNRVLIGFDIILCNEQSV